MGALSVGGGEALNCHRPPFPPTPFRPLHPLHRFAPPCQVRLKLGIGKCKLALQVPDEHKNQPLSSYVGARIVTSFPKIASKFFKPLDDAASALGTPTKTSISYLSGSVEAACGLGLADAVVDLVETGTTMRAAGLCMKETIMTTEAILVSNPKSKHPELADKLIARIQGYMDSTKYGISSCSIKPIHYAH